MIKDNNERVQPLKFAQGTALPYSLLDTRLALANNGKKITIHKGGFGSDTAAHPTRANQLYALTDSGPNAEFHGSEGKGALITVDSNRLYNANSNPNTAEILSSAT